MSPDPSDQFEDGQGLSLTIRRDFLLIVDEVIE